MRRLSPTALLSSLPLALLLAGCPQPAPADAGVEDDAGPPKVPGGGTSGGAVDGLLRVFVINDVDGAPVPGAEVLVGEAGSAAILEIADGEGLAIFQGVSGPQTVTVHGSGLVPTTWVGVPVENVTIPVLVQGRRAPTGQIAAEVADFHANYRPFGDHYTLVLARVTSDRNLARAAAALDPLALPSCAHNGEGEPACSFTLEVPAGRVSLIASILELDGKGTPFDLTDDELVGVMAYGYALDVDVPEDGTVQLGALSILDDDALEELSYPFPAAAPPAGTEAIGFSFLDLGERGVLPVLMPFPAADPLHLLPSLSGPFEGGEYLFMASALTENGRRGSSSFRRGAKSLADVPPLPAWLPPPDDLIADDLRLSWSAVSGAQLYTAEIRQAGATLLWRVYVLDGRTEVTLPQLMPRLPNGGMHLVVGALGGAIDVEGLVVDELLDVVEGTSENTLVYTR